VCGICGVIQVSGEPRIPIEADVLDRMTDAMTHRGPNDRGIQLEPGFALGARRLSIVDLDGGHQPVCNETGEIWAAQNGELYNHHEIRARLQADGHTLTSRCDTEVIPHLYERYGDRFEEELRGKFAIAVWDRRRRRAVIARDRLGVKPLYYAQVGDVVVFASELKSLLASGLIVPELDYEAIDAYLTLGFVPAPRTPIVGVSKLLPGHRLVVGDGRVSEERYWEFPQPRRVSGVSVDEHATRVIEELEEAVRIRLMSDVPLGAMLSGGLDSSLIVGLMARNMSEPVKTFAVGFHEAGDDNELADARFVSDYFGTDHHELELSFDERSVDLADLVWSMDEPLADLSALGFLGLSELASRHVTVALSGQGADELFGGYRKHRAAALAGHWNKLPHGLRRATLAIADRGPAGAQRALATLRADDPATRLLAMSGHMPAGLRRELVRGPLAELDGNAAWRAVNQHCGAISDDPLAATLGLDSQLGLVDDMLHYFDRASMARSLEVRVPFLDHRLVEYCATVPSNLKVKRLTTKYLLKHSARGIVPDRIIDKRKIGFFNSAVDSWFKAQADASIADYLLDSNPRYAEFIDRRRVESLARAHTSGADSSHGYALLSLLMLEVWLSSYLPAALGGRPPVAAAHGAAR
jgi:asparagine synthase (glutamine-hydrolysing)